MINLVIFIISFISWGVCMYNGKGGKFYTWILAFLWGAFLAQTIIWLCGQKTLL